MTSFLQAVVTGFLITFCFNFLVVDTRTGCKMHVNETLLNNKEYLCGFIDIDKMPWSSGNESSAPRPSSFHAEYYNRTGSHRKPKFGLKVTWTMEEQIFHKSTEQKFLLIICPSKHNERKILVNVSTNSHHNKTLNRMLMFSVSLHRLKGMQIKPGNYLIKIHALPMYNKETDPQCEKVTFYIPRQKRNNSMKETDPGGTKRVTRKEMAKQIQSLTEAVTVFIFALVIQLAVFLVLAYYWRKLPCQVSLAESHEDQVLMLVSSTENSERQLRDINHLADHLKNKLKDKFNYNKWSENEQFPEIWLGEKIKSSGAIIFVCSEAGKQSWEQKNETDLYVKGINTMLYLAYKLVNKKIILLCFEEEDKKFILKCFDTPWMKLFVQPNMFAVNCHKSAQNQLLKLVKTQVSWWKRLKLYFINKTLKAK
uniref:Uncharacterized protein LOC100179646 n=1 Tax=Phallusia mammillata TaxID=59560 RepID=A0A6F9DH45_9ASCI|nr:uncharacterized protein LOC100179646 [Phallusia mammillata]